MTTTSREQLGAVVEYVRTMKHDYAKWVIDLPWSMARVVATNLNRRAQRGTHYGVVAVRRV